MCGVACSSPLALRSLHKNTRLSNSLIALSVIICMLPCAVRGQSAHDAMSSPRVVVNLPSRGSNTPAVNEALGEPRPARSNASREYANAATSPTSQAAAPQFSLIAGSYPNAQSVTITDTTPGTTIYYTTNGSYPSTSSTVYSGAITVSTSEVIVAMATAPGYTQSALSSAGYFIATSSSSFIYTLAGNDSWGYAGDGAAATLAQLNGPSGTVMDNAGNLYIVDSGNNAIRKIAAGTGIITTIAGNGIAGHTGDGGAASSAELWLPESIVIDGSGNLYIGELGDNKIRKIDASTGVISTYASGLAIIYAMAIDSSGNLFIASSATVVEVAAGTATVTTVAGNGIPGFSGDGGPATSAEIDVPMGVAVDSLGNLYISDGTDVIRKVAAGTGIITTVVGVPATQGGACKASGDGSPATAASLCLPGAIALDGQNNLYIADTQNSVIREVNAQTGIISTIAGVWGNPTTYAGDGYPATNVGIPFPRYIWVDPAGNVYVSNSSVSRVQKITIPVPPPTQTTATPVFSVPSGTYSSPQTVTVSDTTPGAAYYVSFDSPEPPPTAAQGFHGSFDVTDTIGMDVVAVAPGYLPSAPAVANYMITSQPTSVTSTIAGGGTGGFSTTGGVATNVELGLPQGIAIDKGGNFYFADSIYDVVWKQDASTGNLSVIAGTGVAGYSGDNGPAVSAQLNYPQGVAVDASGNVYIADEDNNRVRMVSAQTGVITTIAGGSGSFSSLGDGGPATQAFLSYPLGLALDAAGNLYIADEGNGRIREVNGQTGIISTVAGGGTANPGDGGAATQATLYPQGVALDTSGNIYIPADGRIRVVWAQTGMISTIAGDGDTGTSGDGGPATEAEVWPGLGIAVDGQGNVYVSSWPSEVRKISNADGTIMLYAGNGYCSWGGDGLSATIAGLCEPEGLAFDSSGNLYIADAGNSRVRKVTAAGGQLPTPVISLPGGTYPGPQTVTISDGDEGATIYYTTDGTTPTTASAVYGPIAVTRSETVQAIAVASGFTQSAVASATYSIPATTPGVQVTPVAFTFSTGQPFAVSVIVTAGRGVIPTGSVTLSSGSYTSAPATLSGGDASITVPAGALNVGTDTLTATYAPDSASSGAFSSTTGTATVTVVPATFTISASALTVTPGGLGSSAVTVASNNDYTGTVTLSCTVTASPAGAVDSPTCTTSGTVSLSGTTTSGTATVTLNSTAARASLVRDVNWWKKTGSGAALAALLFVVVPRRRLRWRAVAALVFLATVAGGLVACGGGGSGSKTNQPTNPGTTAGAYTISVTGTGSDSAKTTAVTTFTLTVN
jgi:sugar lactone lactonase YvrE